MPLAFAGRVAPQRPGNAQQPKADPTRLLQQTAVRADTAAPTTGVRVPTGAAARGDGPCRRRRRLWQSDRIRKKSGRTRTLEVSAHIDILAHISTRK